MSDEARLAMARAAEQFNQGLYFECHETLEEIWLRLRGPARDFLQGLIQVSVGQLHLVRGNKAGALTTFSRALGRFGAYPGRYGGFDLASERARLEALRTALGQGGMAAPGQPPSWQFANVLDQGEDPSR